MSFNQIKFSFQKDIYYIIKMNFFFNKLQEKKKVLLKRRDQILVQQIALIQSTASQLQISLEKAAKLSTLNVQEIVSLFNKAELSSLQILTALSLRCSTTGRQLNLFTLTNFKESIQIAKICDDLRKTTGKRNWTPSDGQFNQKQHFPPLFGVPISIKDVYHLKGIPTTVGALTLADNIQPQSQLIKCFRNSGMIPFIKTTVPQLGMSIQTVSHLWGRTLNPWNKQRSVGGSSGGQAAAISSKCSVLGVGSDIGGSIRIPASHCGVFGLKPYSKRISSHYHAVFSKAFTCFGKTIPLNIGPLGKSSKDLALFMDVATNIQNYGGEDDPYVRVVPFDWKSYRQVQQGSKKYKIGYIKTLKDFEASPASIRAVQEAISILKEQGHEVVEVQIPNERELIKSFISEYFSNGLKGFREILKGEKPLSEYKTNFLVYEAWAPIWHIASLITKLLFPRFYFYLFQNKLSNIFQYQTHIGHMEELKGTFVKNWRDHKLNFMICPGFGCQALPHGSSDISGPIAAYTFIWNVLDMTVGSMPITVVCQDQLNYESRFNDLLTKQLKRVTKLSLGLPVNIQVIGLPYCEQKVLGLMSRIQKKTDFYRHHPLPDC